GTLEPSRLLANSGNVFTQKELERLEKNGAIGDICLHFFNEQGTPIKTSLNERTISMSLDQIKNIDRSVGIAGGKKKIKAIKAAIKGSFINVLITDNFTAKKILNQSKK